MRVVIEIKLVRCKDQTIMWPRTQIEKNIRKFQNTLANNFVLSAPGGRKLGTMRVEL